MWGLRFLPSEVIAAFLWAQLENLEAIQQQRVAVWNTYHKAFNTIQNSSNFILPVIPNYATNNAHMFYLVCKSPELRASLIRYLKEKMYMLFSIIYRYIKVRFIKQNTVV
jgi:Predicted pyridoxal phosphate-dependent enzyme apparently involved in regulation of cell wall biogenesis